MRKRLGIHLPGEEALQLIPQLLRNPAVEIASLVVADVAAVRARLDAIEPGLADRLESALTGDGTAGAAAAALHAVIDGSTAGQAAGTEAIAPRGVPVVSVFAARLLWGHGAPAGLPSRELLRDLRAFVGAYELAEHADDLPARLLEIAVGGVGADGGSLMRLAEGGRALELVASIEIDPERWSEIRVPLGAGIAGRMAARTQALRLRGKASPGAFHILHERFDIAAALCLPLRHGGRTHGVLNLHHHTHRDAFDDVMFLFARHIAALEARLLARVRENRASRALVARAAAGQHVREILAGRGMQPERLAETCRFVASTVGDGFAAVYVADAPDGSLRVAATSVVPSGFDPTRRAAAGRGAAEAVARSRAARFERSPDGRLACASIPLLSEGGLIGVLTVQPGRDAAPDALSQARLQGIAGATAEAVAQAQKLSKTQSRADKLEAIHAHATRIIACEDLADVIRLGTAAAAALLEADHAIVRLRDPATGRFAVRGYSGAADRPLQARLFRLDRKLAAAAIQRRTLVRSRGRSPDAVRAAPGPTVRAALAMPLWDDGEPIGSLAVYDRVAFDRLAAGDFDEQDLELLRRLGAMLERAVANAMVRDRMARFQDFDSETGLPNAAALDGRIHAEIVRSAARDGNLALVVCAVANFDEIAPGENGARGARLVAKISEALRAHLREFDVVGRTGRAEFTVLLPEPGNAPIDRIALLARAVADEICKDDTLGGPVRIALTFGYAFYPSHGRDRVSLLARARVPRIHTM